MTSNLDYYDILGVSKNASLGEIKTKYRILAIKFHPDKTKSVLAEEMMKKINEVYEVLSDPNGRRQYDQNQSQFSTNSHQKVWESKTEKKSTTKQERVMEILQIWIKQGKTIGKELFKLVKEYQNRINQNGYPPEWGSRNFSYSQMRDKQWY